MASENFLTYYRSEAGTRFLVGQVRALAAVAVLLFALFASTDLDRAVTRLAFDDAQRLFPLTGEWWLKNVLHDGARAVSALCGLALLVATVGGWLLPRWLASLYACRQALTYVTIAAFGAATLVGVLKHFSSHACPWDLVDFGGTVVYRHLFAASSKAAAVTGCFPAAHPLSGYAWMAVALVLYPTWRRTALRWWLAAFALGTLFGVVQILRGAHLLSHVLWSGWIVWAAQLALLAVWRWVPLRARATDRATNAGAPA